MRKIFTFLFATLMSVGMFAATVTWNNSTLSSIDMHEGDSFTEGGVTLTVLDGKIDEDSEWKGYSNDALKFSTSLGNFTRIEITATINRLGGSGWTETSPGAVWTGDANETTFNGGFENVSQIVFTIADPTVAVTGVTLDQNEAQMTVGGETLTLTATVAPDDATDKTVTWTSSDPTVATVADGVVTAVAAGTANITVTTTDGNYTATCVVTVTAPEPQPAQQVITWDSNTISSISMRDGGQSFTKDGVTLTLLDGRIAGTRDWRGNSVEASFKFSTSLGNFTRIEITATIRGLEGSGWEQTSPGAVWTGDANEITFGNYFKDVTQIVFTIVESQGGETAVENVQTNHVQATKFFRDGQLLIEKNGKIYTLQGAEVK